MWIALIATVTLSLIWYLLHDHTTWLAVSTDTIFSLGLSLLGLQILGGGSAWNYPAWCLIYFFTCWCIYYIIVYFSKGKKSFQVISCLVMIILGISLQLDEWGGMALFNTTASRGYISFFAGGILYHIYVSIKETSWKRKCGGYCFLWLILCAFIKFIGIDWGPKSATFSLFVFSPFILLVLCFEPLKQLFSLKIMRFLGEISFSVYLCNYSIELFVTLINDTFHLGINLTSRIQWGFYVLFHISVASFVHYVIEKKVSTRLKILLSYNGGDTK